MFSEPFSCTCRCGLDTIERFNRGAVDRLVSLRSNDSKRATIATKATTYPSAELLVGLASRLLAGGAGGAGDAANCAARAELTWPAGLAPNYPSRRLADGHAVDANGGAADDAPVGGL